MFLEHQPIEQIEYYKRLLKSVGSLSRLFSESPEPYLSYRATENLFCKAFNADNLSRSDVSADASKDRIGFGIKTFLEKNGKTMQKVAEFNRDHSEFRELPTQELIKKIAELRNQRLETTMRIYGLDSIIYHCITRDTEKIFVYETPAHLIDIESITDIQSGKTLQFKDKHAEYSFNLSKSTLYMRFNTPEKVILDIAVRILDNPFSEVEKLIQDAGLIFAPMKVQPHVFLPLYSTKGSKHVPEKSGLNQWNADGRKRDPNEIYIPIPVWIHRKFPEFFPSRDTPFELTLPDRKTLNAKVCQDNSKALMSNPNLALGKWLLRDVLNLKENELLTYEKLENIGLDSVVIYKVDNENYDIDFSPIGTYEKFATENGESKESILETDETEE